VRVTKALAHLRWAGRLQSDRGERSTSVRHYYSPLYRQVADPVVPESRPDAPNDLQRERVPALIDALDCLLALWVAEATLDVGPRPIEPSGCSNPGSSPSASQR
jgi:hypothetical protein